MIATRARSAVRALSCFVATVTMDAGSGHRVTYSRREMAVRRLLCLIFGHRRAPIFADYDAESCTRCYATLHRPDSLVVVGMGITPSPRALADAEELMDAWKDVPIHRDILMLNIAALLTVRERERDTCSAGR